MPNGGRGKDYFFNFAGGGHKPCSEHLQTVQRTCGIECQGGLHVIHHKSLAFLFKVGSQILAEFSVLHDCKIQTNILKFVLIVLLPGAYLTKKKGSRSL